MAPGSNKNPSKGGLGVILLEVEFICKFYTVEFGLRLPTQKKIIFLSFLKKLVDAPVFFVVIRTVPSVFMVL